MTQISRRPLDTNTQKRIYEIFIEAIAETSNSQDVHVLLNDFFTYTERVMLPKRLCIAYLLLKNYDQRAISTYLKVSFTTINRVSSSIKNGGNGYSLILKRLQKREQINVIIQQIENGIISMLASLGGKTTVWKHIRNEQKKRVYHERTSF